MERKPRQTSTYSQQDGRRTTREEGWKGPRRLERKILSFCVFRLNCKADREVLRILKRKERRLLMKLAQSFLAPDGINANKRFMN